MPREIELRQKQYQYYRDLLFSFPKPQALAALDNAGDAAGRQTADAPKPRELAVISNTGRIKPTPRRRPASPGQHKRKRVG